MVSVADRPKAAWVLAALAWAVAAAGARPYAGSWNDGSRLAAVESLIDRGTLAIDDSIFVRPPQRLIDAGTPPYPPDRPDLLAHGTQDKLYIDGHFHSDKTPVVSFLMAGLYRPVLWFGGPRPGERPDLFCWIITVLTSGLGYAAAVGCLWALGRRAGLPAGWRLAWVGSFALGTFALAYTRSANGHEMQLGAAAGACLLMARSAEAARAGRTAWGSLVGLGTLTGLGFNLDFGSGPLLVAVAFAVVVWRHRRARPSLAYALAAAPWVAAGLAANYAIGGGWKPPNMYPEHFRFPGSPFSPENITGLLRDRPWLDQLLYAAAMLFGKHGFANHNMPLFLAATVGWRVLRRPFADRAEVSALLFWCGATWLVYSALSNNAGGGCCSIRWFLPLLAPWYWLLAVLLRDRPEYRPDFAVLSAGGLVLAALMWWVGPWTLHMVPQMWPVVGVTSIAWAVVVRHRRRAGERSRRGEAEEEREAGIDGHPTLLPFRFLPSRERLR